MNNTSTLNDYYQQVLISRLSKISTVLNGYSVVSILMTIYFYNYDSIPGLNIGYTPPLKVFFNIFIPMSFLALMWGTKLAINLKAWKTLILNLVKFVLPLLFIIKYYFAFRVNVMEVDLIPIVWWLGFLR